MPNNHDGQAVDAVAFINQLDRSEEVTFRPGRLVHFVTQSGSDYIYDDKYGFIYLNGTTYGREARINGATFGGSMLLINRLVLGAHAEIVYLDGDTPEVQTTSPIVALGEYDA